MRPQVIIKWVHIHLCIFVEHVRVCVCVNAAVYIEREEIPLHRVFFETVSRVGDEASDAAWQWLPVCDGSGISAGAISMHTDP